ncbi:hypothetical protein [Pontibacter sp. G13]|uniref:hypothetical protein n=1 Tax=Pontibacter sp. G13 TaxID=3074898 RepID=UPI00288BA0F6|nr:hypothetical protein [Pontibacter sp. G13]WNJ19851.1 hypothetical protein RJD25_05155 [Pontibacter sp. G13]
MNTQTVSKTTSRICLAILAIPLLLSTLVAQTVGFPDSDFAESGTLHLDIDVDQDHPQLMALQSSGKLLVAGQFESRSQLYRYTVEGRLDSTFGINGILQLPKRVDLRDLVVQKNNRILIAGLASGKGGADFWVCRLTPNGKFDPEFGEAGIYQRHLGGEDEAQRIGLLKDGRIMVAGHTHTYNWKQRNFATMRLNSDGQPDTTFGVDGVQFIDAGQYDFLRDLEVADDGHVILVGHTKRDQINQFVAVRLTPKGKRDLNFGNRGIRHIRLGIENSFCESVALQPDGKIVLVGHAKFAHGQPGFDMVVIRLDEAGNDDPFFGQLGRVVLDYGPFEYAHQVTLLRDGSMLVGGTSNRSICLSRLRPNGNLDRVFGENGHISIQPSPRSRNLLGTFLVQPNDKILISGVIDKQPQIRRFHGNPYLPGLYQVLNFRGEPTPLETAFAQVNLLPDLSFRAWVSESDARDLRRSGTQSCNPPGSHIRKHAHISLGDRLTYTIVWDSSDRALFYVNGLFKHEEMAEKLFWVKN